MSNVVFEIFRITYFFGEEIEEYLVTEHMPRVETCEGGNVDDCTGVEMERDSAHADGSREHISKVCSQLIIGTPLFPPPSSFTRFLSPRLHIMERMRYQGLKLALLPRTNLHGNRPCAGAIYGGRQIAKRTGAGRTWLSMLCAQFSQLHSPLHSCTRSRAPVVVMPPVCVHAA